MFISPSSSVTQQSEPLPLSVSPARRSTFSRAMTRIRNTFRRPASLDQTSNATPCEIGNSDFRKYLYKRKGQVPTARIYNGVKFYNATEPSRQINKCFKCNGDTFIDAEFFGWHAPTGTQFEGCLFKTHDQRLNWMDPIFGNTDWRGSTIDGLYKTSERLAMPSIISPRLSDAQMQHCQFKNLVFGLRSALKCRGVDFSHSQFENVTFTGNTGNGKFPYSFRNGSFEKIRAQNLTFKRVYFENNVNFSNAQIKDLVLKDDVDFCGADFGDYQPRQITLSDKMFASDQSIDRNLNRVNNTLTGADFFNSLASISDVRVRIDWAEQLVTKFKSLELLKNSLQHPSLSESLIEEFSLACYKKSSLISHFLWELLVETFKDTALPAAISLKVTVCQQLVNSLSCKVENHITTEFPDPTIFEYQFLAHQLFASYPSLADIWNQLSPLPELLHNLNNNILMTQNANSGSQRMFYDPHTRLAISIPASEFALLITDLQIPEQFALFEYNRDEDVVNLPVNQQNLSAALRCSTGLQQLWSATGHYLAPVINSFLTMNIPLSDLEHSRLNEIKEHLRAQLLKKSTQKLDLTASADTLLLHSVLADFYRGEPSVARRQKMLESCYKNIQPCFAHARLSENQLKSVISLLLARVFTAFSSSAFCGTESDSPMPLRLLANALLEDSTRYWRELVTDGEMSSWREKLIPRDPRTFSCTALLSGSMSTYGYPSVAGEDLGALMKMLYPL